MEVLSHDEHFSECVNEWLEKEILKDLLLDFSWQLVKETEVTF